MFEVAVVGVFAYIGSSHIWHIDQFTHYEEDLSWVSYKSPYFMEVQH